MASQAEKKAYREKRPAGPDIINIADNFPIEPEVNGRVFIAEALEDVAMMAESKSGPPKQWAIDSGCTNHFCPYKEDFIAYQPYSTPGAVQVGDA